jgi:hypothetical protein
MRDPDPRHDRCLRCGASIDGYPDTGRGREYCGDACRQAGARLRRKHGWYWWRQQPWYQPWVAERAARHEQWERDRPERERKTAEDRAERERKAEEKRRLIDSMPPDVRKSYEAAKDSAYRKSLENTKLQTLQMELINLSHEHEELLRATGHQIRLIDMSRKIEKLLRSALYAENEDEAQAMFDKARKLRAAGEDLDEAPTVTQLLNSFMRDFGVGDYQQH